MKRKCITNTDASLGKITYSSLRNEHLQLVRLELEAREIPYQEDAKIRECGKLLKTSIMKEFKDSSEDFEKAFYPRTVGLHQRFRYSILEEDQ